MAEENGKILEKYIGDKHFDNIKYRSALNQMLEWENVKKYFEDKIDYSSKEAFIKSFEKLREEYYKVRKNYISYSEILYLLGNKKDELQKIGVLIPESKLGKNMEYVTLFSNNEYREIYKNINGNDRYLIDSNLMTKDYEFLLKSEKNSIEELLINSYDGSLSKGTKIIDGKIGENFVNMEEILDIKNGKIYVISTDKRFLNTLEGAKVLNQI